jgi:hypothetical protein
MAENRNCGQKPQRHLYLEKVKICVKIIQLRGRLMVGQRPLKPFILVRIQAPQQEKIAIINFED